MSDPLILKGNKEMQGGVAFIKDGKNLWVVIGPAYADVLLTIEQGYEIIDFLAGVLPPRGKQDNGYKQPKSSKSDSDAESSKRGSKAVSRKQC